MPTSAGSQLHRQASHQQSIPEVTMPTSAGSRLCHLASRQQSGSLHGYSRQVSGADVFVFNPYDATALHSFMNEMFPAAVLLEEHQIR